MAKADRSSQNMRFRKEKKTVDIPDIPKFLLDIPYGILTPYVSVALELQGMLIHVTCCQP